MKTLLQIEKIYKRYGARVIFDDAAAAFGESQKIGVIGRNGAGKSTLCRILTGEEEADDGKIIKSPELKLSYLQQNDPYTLEETVMEFLMRASGREEWECGMVAGQFQLKNEKLEAKIGSLPGGYRTRVKLTAMLLSEPNFLILDEPTNYLDLKTLILLENFLKSFDGAFLIVSHDREFLKRTCEETLEIENGSLTLYPGTVEEYLEFKDQVKEQAVSHNRQVEQKKKQLEEFVTRFRAKASKASQARSKMKQIERLQTIRIDQPLQGARIRIPPVEKKNGIALKTSGLSIGYPEKLVASRIHVEINQGEHVAILGDNGQGKTTFMRTLAGDLQAKSGTYKWGHNLQVAYYAQHVFSSLHPQHTVLDHLNSKAAPGISRQEILNLAANFLFKGDDVQKKVTVLSGGERARLCLAGLLLTKSAVLLLDEPTNHLDFETVEALGNSLKDFQGTLFFISHDRTFVNMLATNIIDVKNGSVIRYPGTYEEYVYRLEKMAQDGADDDSDVPAEAAAEPEEKKSDYHVRKEKTSQIKKLNGEIKRLEERIAAYKKEKQDIEKDFGDHPTHWTREKSDRLQEITKVIDADESKWLELRDRAEGLEARS